MSSFFNNAKQTISDTTSVVFGKTKLAANNLKLQNQISTERRLIQSKYAEIGQKYVELLGDAIPEEEYAEAVMAIRTAQSNIVELEQNIADNKERSSEMTIKPVKEPQVCASCGAPLQDGMKFCTQCGTKIEVPVVEEPVAEAEENEEAEATEGTAKVNLTKDSQELEESEVAGENSVENTEAPVEPEEDVCPTCGMKKIAGNKFCVKCGAPYNK